MAGRCPRCGGSRRRFSPPGTTSARASSWPRWTPQARRAWSCAAIAIRKARANRTPGGAGAACSRSVNARHAAPCSAASTDAGHRTVASCVTRTRSHPWQIAEQQSADRLQSAEAGSSAGSARSPSPRRDSAPRVFICSRRCRAAGSTTSARPRCSGSARRSCGERSRVSERSRRGLLRPAPVLVTRTPPVAREEIAAWFRESRPREVSAPTVGTSSSSASRAAGDQARGSCPALPSRRGSCSTVTCSPSTPAIGPFGIPVLGGWRTCCGSKSRSLCPTAGDTRSATESPLQEPAERGGFEPPDEFPRHTISSRARSAAPAPLQYDRDRLARVRFARCRRRALGPRRRRS